MTLFVGTESRQPLGTEVFVHSVLQQSTENFLFHFLNERLLKQQGLLPENWDRDQLSPHGRARLGALPQRWNHLVGFYPHEKVAALVHWTQGPPEWGADYAEEWFSVAARICGEPVKD